MSEKYRAMPFRRGAVRAEFRGVTLPPPPVGPIRSFDANLLFCYINDIIRVDLSGYLKKKLKYVEDRSLAPIRPRPDASTTPYFYFHSNTTYVQSYVTNLDLNY